MPMASLHLFIIFSLLLFFTTISLASAFPLLHSPGKVSLGLYDESLCPYSAQFMISSLSVIIPKGLIDIADVNLVPWGNARLAANNTFDCQHGPTECLLNTIEACAIDVWPDLNEHFPFVYCVESLVYEGKYSQWETCFSKLGLDSKSVIDCYTSGYGKELELKYAADTNALQPPHTYVPWVVVDGQPIYDDYRNFISYICKAYKGSSLPQACSASSLGGMWKKKNSFSPVCYIEQAANSVIQQIRSAIISWIPSFNVAASI